MKNKGKAKTKSVYVMLIIFSIILIFIIADLITDVILPPGGCACEPGGPDPSLSDYLYSTLIVALPWFLYLLISKRNKATKNI